MKHNQKGALDMMLVVVLVLVLVVGGFTLFRISSTDESDADTSSSSESSSQLIENDSPKSNESETGSTNDQEVQRYAEFVFDEEKDGENVPTSLINHLAKNIEVTVENCMDSIPALEEDPTYRVVDIVDQKYAAAIGTGCTQSSGGYSLLALSEGRWVNVGGGHTNPSCEKLEKYNFPKQIAFSDVGQIQYCNNENGQFVDYPRAN